MTDCYIYDAVRTPRGKGKASGSLHEVTALELATQVLENLRERNNLDTSAIDDVVLGCVDPVKEQGSDIARLAVLNADYAESVAGVQVNRFCASGLEAVNMAAGPPLHFSFLQGIHRQFFCLHWPLSAFPQPFSSGKPTWWP